MAAEVLWHLYPLWRRARFQRALERMGADARIVDAKAKALYDAAVQYALRRQFGTVKL